MAILRNPAKGKFTVVDNYALRDENLSLKAQGLTIKEFILQAIQEKIERGE